MTMPRMEPISLPADAFEKSAEKAAAVDHYADLTPEERIEEGLEPVKPAEPEKPADAPKPEAAAAEPEKKPEPAAEPEPEEDDEAEIDPAISALLEEVAGLREDIASATGKPEPQAASPKEDALLKAAKEHEDPVVQGLAARLEAAEKALEEHRAERRAEKIDAQLAKDDVERDRIQKEFVIAGKPMTDAQMEVVEDFELKNPAVAKALSIEQITRVLFPDATRAGKETPKEPPASKPGKAAGADPPTATIVDTGSAGGAPGGPKERKTYKSIEEAVHAAGKALSLTR